MDGAVDFVRDYDDDTWDETGPTRAVEALLESGQVLAFPRLVFRFDAGERRSLGRTGARFVVCSLDGQIGADNVFADRNLAFAALRATAKAK